MSGLQGWKDLPDGLLHSVVALLSSFRDLVAFAATCSSWRDAFSSYPSKPTFSTLFPPLLLQPDVPLCSPRPVSDNLVPKRPCYVTDLANSNNYPCCQIPVFHPTSAFQKKIPVFPNDLDFSFRGASYGNLIMSDNRSCLVVDVFTGTDVPSPPLPVDKYTQLYYGALTAPLASPNAHLFVNTGSSMFFWRVGSRFWLKRNARVLINRIVAFKGQVFGMGSDWRFFTVNFVPKLRIQKLAVDWGESMAKWHLSIPWLVVCGDMLLMVGCQEYFPSTGDIFEAFRLDLSTEPAKWVRVEKLENWAIFISTDERSQPLSCMNPERWGGKSNCIYCYSHDSKQWIVFELGKPLQGDASDPKVFIFLCCGSMVQPIWVVPSMFSLCL